MCWIRYGRSLRQNEMKKDKNIILDNFIWRFAERCGAQLVTAVVTLLLARILVPEDYGRTALVAVFINILQVFIDSGLGTALIQKKDADDLDFSSVFYFNFAVCLVLYAGMFIAAPYIAAFYKDPSLTPVVRVASLTLVFSGVKGIQQAYVSRNMMFKRFFFATLGGTLFSAFLGLGMAYAGFGVWALVAQQLSNTAIDTLILWLTVHWRPKAVFSWQRLKGLLSYGWRLLASSLLDTVYNNLRSLVIGRVYTSADLAFYNEGMLAPDVIAVNVDSSIDSVLLPAMSAVQDEPARVKNMTRRAIKTCVYVIAPLMMAMFFCAEPLVRLVLTEKWLPCVPYLRIFCITYMFYPIHTANLNAIKAMGRSGVYLKLEISKKIMGLTLGADDYITKPFNPLELVARVKTQLRRYTRYNTGEAAEPRETAEHDFRGLQISRTTHKCVLFGEELALTPLEFAILWYLCEHRGQVVPSEELFEAVWGEKYMDSNNTVMSHIARLREKMHEPSRKPKFIKTVWGVGYTIE